MNWPSVDSIEVLLVALLLAAYVLTVVAAYHRTKHRFPAWQLRAELSAMTTGLTVWVGLGALIGGIR